MRRPLTCFCLMVIGLLLLTQILHPVPKAEYAEFDGKTVILSGKVFKKEVKNNYLQISCKSVQISNSDQIFQNEQFHKLNETEGVICSFSLSEITEDEVKLGSYIQVKGEISEYSLPTNPGEFDLDLYYKSQGIDYMVKNATLLAKTQDYRLFSENLYRFRGRAEKVLSEVLSESAAELMECILLGDKTDLDPELKELFQTSGIAHILAISGLHIAMVGGLLYRMLKRLGLKKWLSASLAILLILSYGIMTGMSVSAFRAILMFSMRVFAEVLRRTYDTLTTLSFAAFLVAVSHPLLLVTASFQLSFGAILGMTLLSPIFKEKKGKMLHGPICIFLATFPILCFHYYSYSTFSLILNLLVVPLMSIVMVLGLLTLGIGFVSIPIATITGKIIVGILWFYEKSCLLLKTFPGNTWNVGRPETWRILVYLTSLFLLTRCYQKISFRLSIIWICVSFCLISMRCYPASTITMLDVGQGDGIVVIDERGDCIMIDGGSSSKSNLAKYSITPFLKSNGIEKIDYAFITHLDSDHYSGILEILENPDLGITVDTIVFSQTVKNSNENPEVYQQFLSLAEQNQVKIVYMKQGDSLKMKNLKMECLWPMGDSKFQDVNSGSLVLELSGKEFTALFTGDISENEEEQILPLLHYQKYNLLKAAHHGSKYSNSQELLDRVKPDTIWISCGVRNTYGHPHREALDRMENTWAHILITKDTGAMSLVLP